MAFTTFNKARDYIILQGNGATPTEVFERIAGLNNLQFAGSTQMDDVTVKEDGNYSAVAPGRNSVTITASGFCRPDTDHDILATEWHAQTLKNYEIKDINGRGWKGAFVVSSYNEAGGIDGGMTFDVTLQSVGAVSKLVVTP